MTTMPDHPALAVRRDRPGWFGLVFAAAWLFYLADPFEAALERRDEPAGWLAMASVVGFAVVYLVSFQWARLRHLMLGARTPALAAVTFLGLASALAILTCVLVGEHGTATVVYLAVMAVFFLPIRLGLAVALLVAAVGYLAGFVVPGWSEDRGLLFGALSATLAVWGIRNLIQRNADLLAAREENARFAVADERNRFARDLHDILGHSLTVITVKAELAQRTFDSDPERARQEVLDLERLSRDALADVRRAVEGYRELTLPGELARARHALAAAGIDHDLPNSTEEVSGDLRELFAWAVREGVTNVIRHSAATTCRVRLGTRSVEIRDDGQGPARDHRGNGLRGLTERAAAVGAVVITESPDDGGFVLRVSA